MSQPNDTNEPSPASAGSRKQDITARLRRWAHSVDAVFASDIMDEAAGVIEKLRRRLRLSDAAVRSQPTLTEEEREAIACAAESYADNDDDEECAKIAATLHGVIERLG